MSPDPSKFVWSEGDLELSSSSPTLSRAGVEQVLATLILGKGLEFKKYNDTVIIAVEVPDKFLLRRVNQATLQNVGSKKMRVVRAYDLNLDIVGEMVFSIEPFDYTSATPTYLHRPEKGGDEVIGIYSVTTRDEQTPDVLGPMLKKLFIKGLPVAMIPAPEFKPQRVAFDLAEVLENNTADKIAARASEILSD